MVELFDVKGLDPGARGTVMSIAPNRKTPGQPDVLIQLLDADGRPTRKAINVKPNNLGAAPEKARLTGPAPPPPRPTDDFGRTEGFERIVRPPPTERRPTDDFGRGPRPVEKPSEPPEKKEKRLAAEEVRGATDEELARQRELGPEVWRQAVANEQANRAAHRADDDKRRAKLTASVNEQATHLSTTDPEERAAGLDKILKNLRFSIIDTDKVHDHVYPPGEGGDWTPERAAQHEAMWDDLLSQIQAADLPKDHDALLLGGLPGAGKSYMLNPGELASDFGVTSWEIDGALPEGATHVTINPDTIKEMMIARGMLPEGISPDLKPREQVTFIHGESLEISKMFTARLAKEGYNVVLDNTMESEGAITRRVTPLARNGYTFRGLFADIPTDESLASAKKRYIADALTPLGGRFVPSSVQGNRKSTKGTMSKNRDTMDSLVAQDWFTEYMIVDNTGVSEGDPKGEVTAHDRGNGSAGARYLPDNDPAPQPAPKPQPIPETPPPVDYQALTDDELLERVLVDDDAIVEVNRRWPATPATPTAARRDLGPIAQGLAEAHPGVSVELSEPSPGIWRLSSIKVDPKAQGQGVASAALRDLVARADADGVTISLTPERIGKAGLSDQQLRTWYKRFGFVPNAGKLPESTDAMFRPPAATPPAPVA